MEEKKQSNQPTVEPEETKDLAQEYLDNWKRERADFINYKKDEARRVEGIIKYSNEGLIEEIIVALDDLDTALANVPGLVKEKEKDWLSGLEKAVAGFQKMLKNYGVEKIKVEGEKFNPGMHEAVEMGSDGGDKIVEIRAGYMMYDKVIRPARVKIVK